MAPAWHFLKVYSVRFVMVCKLIDIALVVLELLIVKRVKENQNLFKAIENILGLKFNHFPKNLAPAWHFLKVYSIRLVKVCRVMDFAFVVLELLIVKILGIIDISKTNSF